MERLLSRNRSQQAQRRCSLGRFPFALGLVICLLSVEQASSQAVHNPVYRHSGAYPPGTHVPQGTSIPGQMMQQALVYGAPVDYQHRWVAAEETNGIEPVPADGEVVDEAGFVEEAWDPMGWMRVWANGVPPRIITVQRYSDHYWQFNIDFLSLNRDSIVGPSRTWLGESRPSGGTRISAKTDQFYSFDLEFAWLGALFWQNTSGEVQWDGVNTNYTPTNMSSNFNAFELNTRWRWVEASGPCTGAWILGVRYIRFAENGVLDSASAGTGRPFIPGTGQNIFSYEKITSATVNDLVGFQLGGELFWSVFKGVMVGGDLKGGIYGNSATRKTIGYDRRPLGGGSGGGNLQLGELTGSSTSFFGEANVMVNAHLGHGWYIRGGYTGLFLTDIVLGSNSLLVPGGEGTVAPEPLRLTQDLIAHGFYGGLEWQY